MKLNELSKNTPNIFKATFLWIALAILTLHDSFCAEKVSRKSPQRRTRQALRNRFIVTFTIKNLHDLTSDGEYDEKSVHNLRGYSENETFDSMRLLDQEILKITKRHKNYIGPNGKVIKACCYNKKKAQHLCSTLNNDPYFGGIIQSAEINRRKPSYPNQTPMELLREDFGLDN